MAVSHVVKCAVQCAAVILFGACAVGIVVYDVQRGAAAKTFDHIMTATVTVILVAAMALSALSAREECRQHGTRRRNFYRHDLWADPRASKTSEVVITYL